MDKNFFKFDIDDEISTKQTASYENKKVQNTSKNIEKSTQNGLFIIKNAKSSAKEQKTGYEKCSGLLSQRELNQTPFKVDDYLNFDFKARLKDSQPDCDQIEKVQILDKEVEKIIEKAQIGVIFY